MLKELLKKSVKSSKSDNVAVLLSGGIDSCVILNLLMDENLEIEPYAIKMDDIDSDDYLSFIDIVEHYDFDYTVVKIDSKTNLDEYKQFLIEHGINPRLKASLLTMSLFCILIDNIDQDVIYTGLGSDAYFGLGRDFMIKSKREEKTKVPTLKSMQEYRIKVYGTYKKQYESAKAYAESKGKTLIAPFMHDDVYNYFWDKTFEEVNQPGRKRILINLYSDFFKRFKARRPSNMQCGNSNFKQLKV